MGFMNAYKRLDNLCRDINGIGVSGYISDMEHTPNGFNLVPGWKNDFDQLKHYRHIRNQIAHDNGADEDNMCSSEDEKWLEIFYNRIMVQNDPLTLHRKATLSRPVRKPTTAVEMSQKPQYTPAHNNINDSTHELPHITTDNIDESIYKLQHILANSIDEFMHEPQCGLTDEENTPMHKPQYMPTSNTGKRMRKFVGYGIMMLSIVVVLAILLLAILYVLFY